MTGRESLKEILGLSVIEWTAPYEQEKNRIAIAECIRKGSIRNLEIDYVSPLGSITPVEINATIENNRESQGIVTLVRDISGRKKAEMALRESENLYGTLADAAQDLIYIINRDDTVAYVNSFAASMLGKSRQEIIGAPRSRFFSGTVGDKQYRNLQQVFTSGMPLRIESTIRLPLKNTWQDTHLVPLKNPAGEVTAIMGISRDITSLKETEVALRESEHQYRSIIENMQDMFYRTDLEGKLTMISPAGAALAGYNSPEEMAGLDVARDLYASSQERRKFLSILSKKGFVTGYPLTLKTHDGQLLSVTASSHFYFDEAGNKQGIEGIIHDITPARRAEDALKEANRKLNLLNSVTRHDVANQLTVLYGYSQLAVLKNTDPVINDFLHKIDAVTATIGRQIEFSKTYQDLGVQEPGWFGLDAIFTRVRPKGILFSNDCTGIEVFADPMLEKVFLNLFGNAVMHGEHVTRITIHCEKAADGDLLITIEDNGVGIPLQEKPKIFRKGYGKHTGFGLFLAREILAITGISIHETGKYGTGARFEIILPKDGYRMRSV
jgi:PAS domain S-box-containing protein